MSRLPDFIVIGAMKCATSTLAGLWTANLLWLLGRSISLTRELVGNKKPHACAQEWRGIWTNALTPLSADGPRMASTA